MKILEKLFGDYSKKEVKRVNPIKEKVLSLDKEYSQLSNKELQHKTVEFQERLAKGETLDDILPEAFAACREAAWRVIGLKHYPVQIIGGILLHQGRIAEMATGAGKTLVATLPAYLNALSGNGVHIVTVNDYLAKRDSDWMGKVYRFMGLSVGLIVHGLSNEERRAAYAADITYGTNNEIGFDYLRDNMVLHKEDKVQRGHNFAIIDEVDSILIDEARTPLIISNISSGTSEWYQKADAFVKTLSKSIIRELEDDDNVEDVAEGDYLVDEKARTATLTQSGMDKAEAFFGISDWMDIENLSLQHYVNQAIKAYGVMQRDIDYIVKDGKVFIVDGFTGRVMEGRRYNDGLHQAIEAKEKVEIAGENKTNASITFQNFFRLYNKLSGMTGTAKTESAEFQEIYKLDVVTVPTHRPVIRIDHKDIIYKTENAKFHAIAEKIKECHEKGQPVLVGTASVEKSEKLSKLLKKEGIKHTVLNAKYHEKEAQIVAQAGKIGAVTIATNMAGRGTDILLGGNAEYLAISKMRQEGYSDELISEATGFAETDNQDLLHAREVFQQYQKVFKQETDKEAEAVRKVGGLYIIGTERHDSRRIDNQLRGRAGRQGDPGESCFYLSLEDDLMRLFGGEKLQVIMGSSDDDIPVISSLVSKQIENAQTNKEAQNFAIRKNVLQYDDVMTKQREIIYEQRDRVLNGEELKPIILDMLEESVKTTVEAYCADGTPKDQWNIQGLYYKYRKWLLNEELYKEIKNTSDTSLIKSLLIDAGKDNFEKREAALGSKLMSGMERRLLLNNVDMYWTEHIESMDELKKGIGLRSYGRQDPVVAYTQEGFELFDEMTAAIREDTVRHVLTAVLRQENQPVVQVVQNAKSSMGVKII